MRESVTKGQVRWPVTLLTLDKKKRRKVLEGGSVGTDGV